MARTVEVPQGEVEEVAVEEATDMQDESGAVVWDAALVLAHYIIRSGRQMLAGKRVVELGAGTGLVGLVAAACGAAQVTLTDLPHMVGRLQHNIELNPELAGRMAAQAFIWGASPVALTPPVDLVLASDLFWDVSRLPALLRSIRWLCGPATTVLAAFEIRPGIQEVAKLLPFMGLRATEVPEEELHEDWRSPDIVVWQLRRVDDDDDDGVLQLDHAPEGQHQLRQQLDQLPAAP